jgi:hypothetical protein
MMETTMTEAERQALIDAAIKDQERRRKQEKRIRQQLEDNLDSAIRQPNDWDPFNGE